MVFIGRRCTRVARGIGTIGVFTIARGIGTIGVCITAVLVVVFLRDLFLFDRHRG